MPERKRFFSMDLFPYIAGHLPVVPIHVVRTFTLADDGGGVPVEPGGVGSEAQLIFRTLELCFGDNLRIHNEERRKLQLRCFWFEYIKHYHN